MKCCIVIYCVISVCSHYEHIRFKWAPAESTVTSVGDKNQANKEGESDLLVQQPVQSYFHASFHYNPY